MTYTDPTSGNTGEYYVVRQGAMRPSATGTITVTNPNYQVYHGVDITLTKRYRDRWQLAGGADNSGQPSVLPSGVVGLLATRPVASIATGSASSRSTC